MKKKYEAPRIEMVEFRFEDHIAASGSSCYWGGTDSYTHGYSGCKDQLTTKEGWIDLNG